jgi:integrase
MTEKDILTTDEINWLIDRLSRDETPRAQRNLLIFVVLITTGVRRSEAVSLNWGDFDFCGEPPYLHVRQEVAGKKRAGRGRARTVRLDWNRRGLALLRSLRPEDAGAETPVLRSQTTGGRMSDSALWRHWRTITGLLGPERQKQLKGPHTARHTWCTYAAGLIGSDEVNGDLKTEEVAAAMGHKHTQTMDEYRHLRERMRKPAPRRGMYE